MSLYRELFSQKFELPSLDNIPILEVIKQNGGTRKRELVILIVSMEFQEVLMGWRKPEEAELCKEFGLDTSNLFKWLKEGKSE